jgi:ribokinase
VLGSFMMDMTVRAPRRPEPGETLVGSSFAMFLGGKGFNQAVAAARSGAATSIVGRVGDDAFGRQFLDCLVAEGIDAGHVERDPVEGTGVGAPLVDDRGENSIVIVPRANTRVSVADVERAAPLITAADVLLLQLELPLDTVVAAAGLARLAGVTVVLNPAPAVDRVDRFAGLVDLLVPNRVEAAGLTRCAPGAEPSTMAAALHARTGATVVVTLGAEGVLLLDPAGREAGRGTVLEAVPAHPVAVVDSTGAGDAFCGALGARLAAGDGPSAAVAYANAAAGLAVTRAGAEPSIPTAAEVAALLAAAPPARPVLG